MNPNASFLIQYVEVYQWGRPSTLIWKLNILIPTKCYTTNAREQSYMHHWKTRNAAEAA